MNKLPRRKNIRLKDHNYLQEGYYFITISSKNKKNLFWNVGATCGRQIEDTKLSELGKIVDLEINKIGCIYENMIVNKYVIMPNHIHLIIVLHAGNGRQRLPLRLEPKILRISSEFIVIKAIFLWYTYLYRLNLFYNEVVKINQPIEEKRSQYEVIPEIIKYISKKIKPTKIILFGSCARGIITRYSDIDLCVIVKDEMIPRERTELRGVLLLGLLDITDYEVDIYLCSERQWQEKHKNQDTFLGKIYKEGKIIYGG